MKFFKTGKVKFTALLLIPILMIGIIFVTPVAKRVQAEEAVHTYTESLDEIVNPATGFYKRVGVKLSRGSSTLAPGVLGNIAAYAKGRSEDGKLKDKYGIIQLCFDLSAFSSNAGGVTAEIDDSALSAVESVFAALRTNKVGAIIRFDYDRNGAGGDREPALDMVKQHIRNVSTVITKYSDVVLGVESGMLGKWGEQHSTTLANDWTNYYDIVEEWLQSTPEKIGITVRRPAFFVYWANERYGLNLTASGLADFDFSAYPQSKRVGVYNDGYLGSSSDLGTFTDRSTETAFIGKQAERTYYGGELVADSQTGLLGNYNSMSFLEVEGFKTHTSYLNIDWNDSVFAAYKERTYNGKDELYKGNTTEFTYLKNRLGYRFYLSESTDLSSDETDEVNLKFTIANAGFARLLRPARSELVFKSATESVAVDCTDSVDLSQIPSDGSETFEFSVEIPEELPYGDYDIYLRFYTEYGAEIKLANDITVCAPDREGVKVATVTKKAPVTLAGIAVTSDPVKTTYTVGDALDITGLAVTATYSDGATAPVNVTTDMLSDYDMTAAGTYHVKVTCEGKFATFDIVVSATQSIDPPVVRPPVEPDPPAVTVSSLAVKVYPTKTTYVTGETIDLTGLAVTATYSDGTTSAVTVTVDMLSGYDMTLVGTQTVKITYEGKVTGFNIIVREEQAPPGGGESDKNFLRDNAVLIGCIAAAVVAVVAVIIVVAVKLKRKK